MAGGLQEELRANGSIARAPSASVDPQEQRRPRPLGIPTIRDRVAQMAVLLVIGPIFEADLCDEQYGFRPGVDAKMAVRRVYFNVTSRASERWSTRTCPTTSTRSRTAR